MPRNGNIARNLRKKLGTLGIESATSLEAWYQEKSTQLNSEFLIHVRDMARKLFRNERAIVDAVFDRSLRRKACRRCCISQSESATVCQSCGKDDGWLPAPPLPVTGEGKPIGEYKRKGPKSRLKHYLSLKPQSRGETIGRPSRSIR